MIIRMMRKFVMVRKDGEDGDLDEDGKGAAESDQQGSVGLVPSTKTHCYSL